MTTSKYYYSGKFGIERETLRVDSHGRLAHTLRTLSGMTAISHEISVRIRLSL